MAKIIIANWKMNPASEKEAIALAKASDAEESIIAPPFPFLPAVSKVIKKSELAAQDVFWEIKGAFTGEVSVSQIKSLGVKYVIIGHSERRALGETNEMVAKKVTAAIDGGLIPILCVGETRDERTANKQVFVIRNQIKTAISLTDKPKFEILIAYEPIWAIGSGSSDKPEDMIQMSGIIKDALPENAKAKIIYGGSVNSMDAEEFLKHKEINGVLVGGASLNKEEIKKIIKVAKL